MENSRRGERRIYIYIHRAFYLICNSNRLAQRVLGRTCVFTREREREGGGREGKGRRRIVEVPPQQGVRTQSPGSVYRGYTSKLIFVSSIPPNLGSRSIIRRQSRIIIEAESKLLFFLIYFDSFADNRLKVRCQKWNNVASSDYFNFPIIILRLVHPHPHRRTNCYKKT